MLDIVITPHKQVLLKDIHILIQIHDIAVIPGQEARHVRDNTLPVRTVQQENCPGV